MTREEFESTVMGAYNGDVDHQERVLTVVRERLRGLDDLQRFQLLFPVAVEEQGDHPVADAAIFLRQLSPACTLTCEEAVRALLPSWDISIEEVPFYLAARFGASRVRQAIERLESEITDENKE